jgi:flagellin
VPQTINTNLVSLNAQRNLSTSQSALSTSMQRLSSGLRVNSAKDDAAGLAIAERMHTQVRGMNVAMRNANDGISLAQVAEGALGKTSDLFQRMRELAVQAANGTNSEADRLSLNEEFTQLAQEATRTLAGTTFNNTPVLASSNATVYQIGANNSTSGVDQISIQPFDWAGTDGSYINAVLGSDILLGTNGPTSVISGSDGSSALLAITAIDSAINQLNSQRGTFGAVQNRFENVVATLMVSSENQSAARSRIMDADYAAETASMSRAQILQQAGNAMVAQANQLPQQVLSLLQALDTARTTLACAGCPQVRRRLADKGSKGASRPQVLATPWSPFSLAKPSLAPAAGDIHGRDHFPRHRQWAGHQQHGHPAGGAGEPPIDADEGRGHVLADASIELRQAQQPVQRLQSASNKLNGTSLWAQATASSSDSASVSVSPVAQAPPQATTR